MRKVSLSQRAATFRSRRANLPRLVNFIGLFRPGEGKEPRRAPASIEGRENARTFAFSNSINALTIGDGLSPDRRVRIPDDLACSEIARRAITLRSVRAVIRNEPARNVETLLPVYIYIAFSVSYVWRGCSSLFFSPIFFCR